MHTTSAPYVQLGEFLVFVGSAVTDEKEIPEDVLGRLTTLRSAAQECVERITKRRFDMIPDEARDFWPERGAKDIYIGDVVDLSQVDITPFLKVEEPHLAKEGQEEPVPLTVPDVRFNGEFRQGFWRLHHLKYGRPSALLVGVDGRPLRPIWETRDVRVTVTATWGWHEVPMGIKQAVLMLMNRWQQRAKSPLGSVTIGDEMMMMVYSDPDIKSLLMDYKLEVGA